MVLRKLVLSNFSVHRARAALLHTDRQGDVGSLFDRPAAELAIALLNPALRYSPQTLRLGAAMLSALDNEPGKIARLSRLNHRERREHKKETSVSES